MGYTIEEQSWKDCEQTIRRFTRDNTYLSPYSDYAFLSRIRNSPNVHALKRFYTSRFHCYVIGHEGEPVLIAPLYVNQRQKKLWLIGEFCSVGHMDFLYAPDLREEDFREALKQIGSLYPGYTLELNQLSQFSLTARYLEGMKPHCRADVCVKIDLSDYDTWYKNLKKSPRQNLRTAYNRMKTDEADMEFYMVVGEKPERKYVKDNLKLFSQRILEHSRLSKGLYFPMKMLKSHEALTKALFDCPDNIFASVYINGRLAASCNGVIARDGRAIITRLSVELDLGRYSPGGLLINEMVKACGEKYPRIRAIDLSRGDEPYKYTYGGVEHYNYSFSVPMGEKL